MCTVIAWNGQLPKGFLTSLIIAAEVRGRDSVGIAWRDEEAKKIMINKRACSPRQFAEDCQATIGDARRTAIGIGHTRRASPGMPVDGLNAHPFIYKGAVFAHNGKVDNWKALRDGGLAPVLEGQGATEDEKAAIRNAATDSIVIGPLIKAEDFTQMTGCAGLVWMQKDKAYCFRTQKELTSAVLEWTEDAVAQRVCIVCSTLDIVKAAVEKTKALKNTAYALVEQPLDENTLYEIRQTGCASHGARRVNPANHADAFTSHVADGTLNELELPDSTKPF